MFDNYNKYKGFSLIEMSISLVIIALLTAAVMQGQNLIAAAQLRTVISEVAEHKTSLNSFYAKFSQLPGDYNDAARQFASATVDGDGDGQIDFVASGVYEGYRAWQHLSYAKMTKNQYVGTETTGAAVLEVDVPKSAYHGGYFLEYGVFGLTIDNSLVYGLPNATAAAPILVAAVIKPGQAFEIDSKIDDHNPSTGDVRGQDGNGVAVAESCVDDPSDDGANAEDFYNMGVTNVTCTMAFKMLEQ